MPTSQNVTREKFLLKNKEKGKLNKTLFGVLFISYYRVYAQAEVLGKKEGSGPMMNVLMAGSL